MSKNTPARLTVLRTETVAPAMRRLVLGGPGFAEFLVNRRGMQQPYTDEYVKLVFLADGFDYPEPLDLAIVKDTMPAEARPVLRTYTVRWVDEVAAELAIDFVVHGDAGIAGPWAARAEPGDTIHVRGPSGGYVPDPSADWHLFVGDEAGLPAITASIEALPAGARAVAFVEIGGPADEIAIATVADLELHWLHRGDAEPGTTTLLDDAVRALRGPPVVCRPSCTASRRCSRASARTCWPTAVSPSRTCRCRRTGGAARPRRASGSGSRSRPRPSSVRPRPDPSSRPAGDGSFGLSAAGAAGRQKDRSGRGWAVRRAPTRCGLTGR
jgi:NADPH-dependent ferric siderophore reductase